MARWLERKNSGGPLQGVLPLSDGATCWLAQQARPPEPAAVAAQSEGK